MGRTTAVHDDTFGVALTIDGKSATDTILFYQRELNLARTGCIQDQEILAAAMAHEIGHLLLGPSHSSEGIMRAKWKRDEAELARLGLSRFTAEQSALQKTTFERNKSLLVGKWRVISLPSFPVDGLPVYSPLGR